MFAQFRKSEFKQRLEEKAISTVALVADLNVSKQDVLAILDENSIDKLYINRILVFGKDTNLIYSNVSGTAQILSSADLQTLKKKGSFFVSENQIDRFGILYEIHNDNEFYVLITAEDKPGHRHLWYLGYLLLGAFIAGTTSVIILARSLSGRILLPLRQIQQRITDISEKKLHIRLEETRNNDEIDKLAQAFNEMMDRIDSSYKQQKEFTDNASHELRTPVTRIIMQIQNLITLESHSDKTKQYLNSIMMDSNQIADTISSLLLLSRIDSGKISGFFPPCRLDEIIFDSIQFVSKAYSDVRVHFNIENQSDNEIDIEIKGDSNLLKIVFVNLFKNAYLYSSDKHINVTLIQKNEILKVVITNNGELISPDDRENLFKAFARGKNSKNIQGTGLGLRITERILNHHNAQIEYEALNENSNSFTVLFKF
jgi:signal transduction histidine kinase